MYKDLSPLPGTTFIGLGHKCRQGKDIAAQAIHAAYPELTAVIGFADDLKAYCRIKEGMTVKDGQLLQGVGTYLRSFDEDIFVRSVYWRAAELQPRFVVIPDMRYRNEADFIHAMGGKCIHIRRLLPDGRQFISPDRPASHPSETDLAGFLSWDAAISVADGDLAFLREHAVRVFEDYLHS